jgi:hypothetical protein
MSYGDDYSDSGPLFKDVATIDIKRKKKINIRLEDEDGGSIDMQETIDNINRYITDQLTLETDNKLRDEVYPLITQVCMGGVTYAMGSQQAAAFVVSQEILRYGLGHQMLLSFYFLKFIQKNNIKVITEETDVTDEEIERLLRVSKAAGTATLAAMMGMPPKEIIQELLKSGQITQDDIKSFDMGENSDVSDKESDEVDEQTDEGKTSGKKNSKPDPNVN